MLLHEFHTQSTITFFTKRFLSFYLRIAIGDCFERQIQEIVSQEPDSRASVSPEFQVSSGILLFSNWAAEQEKEVPSTGSESAADSSGTRAVQLTVQVISFLQLVVKLFEGAKQRL